MTNCGVKSVSQFIAIQNATCIATRQNCIANCDAIPVISKAGKLRVTITVITENDYQSKSVSVL